MKRAVAVLPIAALALAACGSDGSGISIEGAWARTSAEGQTTGAVYFEITADEDDTLLAVSVPASVAADAQIHEVVPADIDGGDTGGLSGAEDMGDGEMAMVMRELDDGLPLPAGETVTLAPGGHHVMLLDVAEPLEVGDEIELTLDFATADDTTVSVEAAESAP